MLEFGLASDLIVIGATYASSLRDIDPIGPYHVNRDVLISLLDYLGYTICLNSQQQVELVCFSTVPSCSCPFVVVFPNVGTAGVLCDLISARCR